MMFVRENTMITLDENEATILMELLVHEIEALDNEIGNNQPGDTDPIADAIEVYNNILDRIQAQLTHD